MPFDDAQHENVEKVLLLSSRCTLLEKRNEELSQLLDDNKQQNAKRVRNHLEMEWGEMGMISEIVRRFPEE